MKNLLLTLSVFFLSAPAFADGLNWKGSCQGPAGISVRNEPWDDDVRILVTQEQKTLFDATASSSVIDAGASDVSFRGSDSKRKASLEMSIVRKEGREPRPSRLVLNHGPTLGLSNCTLDLVNE